MTNFVTGLDWFDPILPSGVPVPSSILISGPSGTGKPFVGLAVAASWLKQGGRVVFIPIHGAYPSLFESGLKSLHDLSLAEYSGSHFFVLLDTIQDTKGWTYLLAISSSILKKKSIVLEQAADHLFLMRRGAQGRQLQLRAARVRGAPFHIEPVTIPRRLGLIRELKEEAVASRRILIPTVSKV